MILVIKISEPTGNCSGFIKRISAKIPTILYTFDPKIVPTARLDCFLKAAAIPVASSGRDVPKATKVKPIIVSEILNEIASFWDPMIKYFEPK